MTPDEIKEAFNKMKIDWSGLKRLFEVDIHGHFIGIVTWAYEKEDSCPLVQRLERGSLKPDVDGSSPSGAIETIDR